MAVSVGPGPGDEKGKLYGCMCMREQMLLLPQIDNTKMQGAPDGSTYISMWRVVLPALACAYPIVPTGWFWAGPQVQRRLEEQAGTGLVLLLAAFPCTCGCAKKS